MLKKHLSIETIWLLIIMGATFFFRFYHFAGFSLSNDELSAVNRLNFNSISDVIHFGIRPDGHPAGAQLLLWFWTHIFGLSPASVRFPFVFISALAPLFGYLFMRRITSSTPALFLATALAFLSFPQLYGQIARPYGIGLSFTLMAAVFWAEIIFRFSENKTKNMLMAIGLALSWTLNLYTHYFAALMTVVMGFSGLLFLKKSNIKYYLTAAMATVLLFLPHMEITLHQIGIGGIGGWLGKPDTLWLWHHILFIFNNSYLVLTLILFLIFGLILLGHKTERRFLKIRLLLFLWFIIPFLTGFLYSIFVNPVLQNSVLIFSMPFLLAFLFSFVPSRFTHTNRIALIGLGLFLVIHTFFIKSYYKQQHFAEFEQVPIVLKQWEDKNPNHSILNLVQINHPNYLKYYLEQQNSSLDFLGRNFKTLEDMDVLKNIIDTTTADYISFSDIQNVSSHIALSIIESKYPVVVDSRSYGNKTDMWLLKKENKESNRAFPDSLYSTKEFIGGKEIILRKDYGDSSLLFIRAYYKIHIATFTPETHLVYDIQDIDGKSLVWKSFPIRYAVGVSPWITARLIDKIKMKPNFYKIKIYLWNPKRERIGIKRKQIRLRYLI